MGLHAFAMPAGSPSTSSTQGTPPATCSAAGHPTASPAAASELVLLGTGVSTALPRISCVLRGRLQEGAEATAKGAFVSCDVCQSGLKDPLSRNRRCNVSALVRLGESAVLIDCGKTVREACMRQLPRLSVRTVDAVVLTHGHADAILGLDDLRDIQAGEGLGDSAPTPVWLSEKTMDDVSSVFHYLVPKEQKGGGDGGGGDAPDIARRVTKIHFNVFTYFRPFHPVPGIECVPIPVLHGGDYVAAGFVIRGGFANGSTIAYLSDVNQVPTETMEFLQSLEDGIDVLIVDALHPTKPYRSHFCLTEAVDLARQLRPTVTRCVGMSCSVGDHDTVNAELELLQESEGLDVRLGYDGQRLPL
jgi:phosphoribosyl 1,2-cyclic phosphodiesterase